MANNSVASSPSLDDGEECYSYNPTGFPTSNISDYDFSILHCSSECKVTISFACLICSLGLVGNGMVIWLLGFCMKRNPFTTFILNLAVADFGVLVCIVINSVFYIIYLFSNRNQFLFHFSLWARLLYMLFFFMHLTGQFLLTAISIDRCMSVLFPVWHRCHRPTYLSASVSALLWATSFLFCLILFTAPPNTITAIMLTVTPLPCLPFMVVSSMIIFIKVCFKSPKHKRGKALIAILLTLIFFLIFAFPLTTSFFIFSFFICFVKYHNVIQYIFLGASLNSSVNPLIYFLVGNKKRVSRREKMRNILQRLFKEEEGHGPEIEYQV
nr:mas-related G-protein coupled receptor member H-like [Anolis sagrei ordinatus]